MKGFKPKMTDGSGSSMGMSPEAHKEWSDKEGKHSSMGMGKVSTNKYQPGKKVGPDGFDPGKGVKSHEAAQKKKGSHGENHGNHNSSGAAATGHKTGPQKHAGKGASEGSTKGFGGSGKVNYGNGLKAGKAVRGLGRK